jgi:hypothetical protein
MAQLLAPRSARIGVPNVTGYKRIVWHKACADPRISLVMLTTTRRAGGSRGPTVSCEALRPLSAGGFMLRAT